MLACMGHVLCRRCIVAVKRVPLLALWLCCCGVPSAAGVVQECVLCDAVVVSTTVSVIVTTD